MCNARAGTASEDVSVLPSIQKVVADFAQQHVEAPAAKEDVVAAKAQQDVIALLTNAADIAGKTMFRWAS